MDEAPMFLTTLMDGDNLFYFALGGFGALFIFLLAVIAAEMVYRHHDG